MDQFEMLDRARADFERRLRSVTTADWPRPTPCPEWTVRDLVNHVVGGNWRYVTLLHGAAGDSVKPGHDEDVLGDDALTAFAIGADAVSAAFREAGAMERVVHHRSGDMPGDRLLALRITDFAIHGWDLARAIGGDCDIDAAVTEWLNHILPSIIPDLVELGFYSPTGGRPSAAAGQARLLHLVGREP